MHQMKFFGCCKISLQASANLTSRYVFVGQLKVIRTASNLNQFLFCFTSTSVSPEKSVNPEFESFSGTFFLYAGVCLVGTIFTFVFVPETRGKSIEEIQLFFEGKRRTTLTTATPNDKSLETPLQQTNA